MDLKKVFALIFSIVIYMLIPIFSINASANYNQVIIGELEVYTYDDQYTKDELWNRLKLNVSDKSMLKTGAIYSFDVNEDGLIAIFFKQNDNSYIEVYDSNGLFVYGFSLAKFKGTDFVFWTESTINFYCADNLFSIGRNGNCEGVYSVPNSANNRNYKSNYLKSDKKIVGEKTYIITNGNVFLDTVFSSCGKLYLIDENGKEIVIYNQLHTQYVRLLFPWITVVLFIVVTLTFFIKKLTNDSHAITKTT